MFGIRVDFLTGRYVATRYNNRNEAEWPPHPARLFSALVAAWAEHEPDADAGREELAGLEWLEEQDAPRIRADLDVQAGDEVKRGDRKPRIARRTVSPVFVPVNDTSVVQQPDNQRAELASAEAELASASTAAEIKASEKKFKKAAESLIKRTEAAIGAPKTFGAGPLAEAVQMLPEQRKKQARTFPSITPAEPSVEFWWPEAPPPAARAALQRVLSRVARLGHSSSLVAVREASALADATAPLAYEPTPDGDLFLRWVSAGQTERLRAYHEQHLQVEPRVMPSTFVAYSDQPRTQVSLAHSHFETQWIVLARTGGPRLPITSVAGVTGLLRRALQSKSVQPVPEVISGHRPDGPASEQPHMAVVALPNVGSNHPDGAILGLAIVLPRGLEPAERSKVMAAIAGLEQAEPDEQELTIKLNLSATKEQLVFERVGVTRPPQSTLRAGVWTRPSREWVTATPIALDRNPGDLHHTDPEKRRAAFEAAEETIALAAMRIGLPRPVEVEVSRSVLLPGTAKPRHYPRYPVNTARPQNVLVQARLVFAQPVRGPVLLGAGRYLGLGLCRPVDRGGRDE